MDHPQVHDCVVHLNGEEIHGVFYADEESGIVQRYTTPRRLTPSREACVTETVTGTVTVALRGGGRPIDMSDPAAVLQLADSSQSPEGTAAGEIPDSK